MSPSLCIYCSNSHEDHSLWWWWASLCFNSNTNLRSMPPSMRSFLSEIPPLAAEQINRRSKSAFIYTSIEVIMRLTKQSETELN